MTRFQQNNSALVVDGQPDADAPLPVVIATTTESPAVTTPAPPPQLLITGLPRRIDGNNQLTLRDLAASAHATTTAHRGTWGAPRTRQLAIKTYPSSFTLHQQNLESRQIQQPRLLNTIGGGGGERATSSLSQEARPISAQRIIIPFSSQGSRTRSLPPPTFPSVVLTRIRMPTVVGASAVARPAVGPSAAVSASGSGTSSSQMQPGGSVRARRPPLSPRKKGIKKKKKRVEIDGSRIMRRNAETFCQFVSGVMRRPPPMRIARRRSSETATSAASAVQPTAVLPSRTLELRATVSTAAPPAPPSPPPPFPIRIKTEPGSVKAEKRSPTPSDCQMTPIQRPPTPIERPPMPSDFQPTPIECPRTPTPPPVAGPPEQRPPPPSEPSCSSSSKNGLAGARAEDGEPAARRRKKHFDGGAPPTAKKDLKSRAKKAFRHFQELRSLLTTSCRPAAAAVSFSDYEHLNAVEAILIRFYNSLAHRPEADGLSVPTQIDHVEEGTAAGVDHQQHAESDSPPSGQPQSAILTTPSLLPDAAILSPVNRQMTLRPATLQAPQAAHVTLPPQAVHQSPSQAARAHQAASQAAHMAHAFALQAAHAHQSPSQTFTAPIPAPPAPAVRSSTDQAIDSVLERNRAAAMRQSIRIRSASDLFSSSDEEEDSSAWPGIEQQLRAMGFGPPREVRRVTILCKGKLDEAIDLLLHKRVE